MRFTCQGCRIKRQGNFPWILPKCLAFPDRQVYDIIMKITPIEITDKIRSKFKPSRLYIKELNGLRYFGKTVAADATKYYGSGTRWLKQIKKYGRKNIRTIWVSELFTDPEDIQDFALLFSEVHQIVENPQWANLIPENGLTGMVGSKKGHMKGIPKPKSQEHRKSIADTLNGVTLEDRYGKEKADEMKAERSKRSTGRKQSPAAIQKTAAFHTGRKRSEETRRRQREERARRKPKLCKHCGNSYLPGNYDRWHGDNCHKNPSSKRYKP